MKEDKPSDTTTQFIKQEKMQEMTTIKWQAAVVDLHNQ